MSQAYRPTETRSLSNKAIKRLGDIIKTLNCYETPHIQKEALLKIPQFVETEKATSGPQALSLATEVIFELIGFHLQNQEKCYSNFFKGTLPNLDVQCISLVPDALDVLEQLHLSNSENNNHYKFLQWLSRQILSQGKFENESLVYVVQWMIKRALYLIVKKEMILLEGKNEIKSFTYLDLLNTLTKKTSFDHSDVNYGFIAFDYLFELFNEITLQEEEKEIFDDLSLEEKNELPRTMTDTIIATINFFLKSALLDHSETTTLRFFYFLHHWIIRYIENTVISTDEDNNNNSTTFTNSLVILWKIIMYCITLVRHTRLQTRLNFKFQMSESFNDEKKNSFFEYKNNNCILIALSNLVTLCITCLPYALENDLTMKNGYIGNVFNQLFNTLIEEALTCSHLNDISGYRQCLDLYICLLNSWSNTLPLTLLLDHSLIMSWFLWISIGDSATLQKPLTIAQRLLQNLKQHIIVNSKFFLTSMEETCITSNTDIHNIKIVLEILTAICCLSLPCYGLQHTKAKTLLIKNSIESILQHTSTLIQQFVEPILIQRFDFIKNYYYCNSNTESQEDIILTGNNMTLQSMDLIRTIITKDDNFIYCQNYIMFQPIRILKQLLIDITTSMVFNLKTLTEFVRSYLNEMQFYLQKVCHYQSFVFAYILHFEFFLCYRLNVIMLRTMNKQFTINNVLCSWCKIQPSILCNVITATLISIWKHAESYSSLWGDKYIPLFLNLVQYTYEQDQHIKNTICPQIQTTTLRVIASFNHNKALIPTLFRCLMMIAPIDKILIQPLSILPNDANILTSASLSIILSALSEVYLGGELGISKLQNLLHYCSTDPLLIRLTRLRIFNDMAEEFPNDAIECLKDIQLGLKDENDEVRGLSLRCLARLCCQDVMDFSKVWSILNSKHYVKSILDSSSLSLCSSSHLASFLKQYGQRYIIPQTTTFLQDIQNPQIIGSTVNNSNVFQTPLITQTITLVELTLQLVDRMLTFLSPTINVSIVMNLNSLLELLGQLIQQLICMAQILNNGTSSFDTILPCENLPLFLTKSVLPEWVTRHGKPNLIPEPTSPLYWSSPLTPLRLIVPILSLLHRTSYFAMTDSVQNLVEDGCSKLLYFALNLSRRDLGRRRPDRPGDLSGLSATYSLLTKALHGFLVQYSNICSSSTRSMLSLILAVPPSRKYVSSSMSSQLQNTPTEPPYATCGYPDLFEMINDLDFPQLMYGDIIFLQNFWQTYFSRTLFASLSRTKGHDETSILDSTSKNSPVLDRLKWLLSLLYLSHFEKEPILELLLDSTSDVNDNTGKTPTEVNSSSQCPITASGCPQIFLNIILAVSALCKSPNVPIPIVSMVVEFLLRLLHRQLEQTASTDGDVWEISSRLSTNYLISASQLYHRSPNSRFDFTCFCLLSKLASSSSSSHVKKCLINFILKYNSLPGTSQKYNIASNIDSNDTNLNLINVKEDSFPSDLIGVSTYCMHVIITHNIDLLETGIKLEAAILEASACNPSYTQKGEISARNKSNYMSAVYAALGLCETFHFLDLYWASEMNLELVKFIIQQLLVDIGISGCDASPTILPSTVEKSTYRYYLDIFALPISLGYYILWKHGKVLEIKGLCGLIVLLENTLISTKDYGFSTRVLVTQVYKFLEAIRNQFFPFWDFATIASRDEFNSLLCRLRAALSYSISGTAKTENTSTALPLGFQNPHSLSSMWNQITSYEIWDKQLALLVLNSVPIFSFSAECTANNIGDTSSLKDPKDLATLLKALGILDSNTATFADSTGLARSHRVNLDFRYFLETAGKSRFHQQSLVLVGIIYHYLMSPQESRKIILPAAESGTGILLNVMLRLLTEFSDFQFQKTHIFFSFNNNATVAPIGYTSQDNIKTPSLATEVSAITENECVIRNRNKSTLISFVSVMWKALSLLDALPNINLAPTVARYFDLCSTILSVNQQFTDTKQKRINQVCACNLFLHLLTVSNIHGINEERLEHLLYEHILEVFCDSHSSLREAKTQNNINCHILFPRFVVLRCIQLLPSLGFSRIAPTRYIDLNKLLLNTMPSLYEDPYGWAFYLQQICRLCRANILALSESVMRFFNKIGSNVVIPQLRDQTFDMLSVLATTDNKSVITISLKTVTRLINECIIPCVVDQSTPQTAKMFKSNIPTCIIASFFDLMEVYIQQMDNYYNTWLNRNDRDNDILADDKNFIEDLTIRLPSPVVAYLISKGVLPLDSLQKHRQWLLEHALEQQQDGQPNQNSDNSLMVKSRKAFALAIACLQPEQQIEAIKGLLYASTSPYVCKGSIRSILTEIFLKIGEMYYQISVYNSRTLSENSDMKNNTNNMSTARLSSPISTLSRTETCNADILFSETYCRKETPIFTSSCLFNSEAACELLARQDHQQPLYSLLGMPVLLPINKSYFSPDSCLVSKEINQSFEIGVFPFPSCFSPTLEEFLSRKLCGINTTSTERATYPVRADWKNTNSLEGCNWLSMVGKKFNLSNLEVDKLIAQRRRQILKTCRLERDILPMLKNGEVNLNLIEKLDTAVSNPENDINSKMAFSNGRTLLRLYCSSNTKLYNELLQLLSWAYES